MSSVASANSKPLPAPQKAAPRPAPKVVNHGAANSRRATQPPPQAPRPTEVKGRNINTHA